MYCHWRSSYQDGRVGIQLSRWEGWDPVIKMGGLRSSYQDGRVGIQLSRWEGWNPVIKMGVGIQLSRWEGRDPVIKMGRLGSSYQDGRVGNPLTGLTLPHYCACPKPGSGYSTPYVMVFLFVQGVLWLFILFYNYLCNQCLSPLKLWVWIPLRRGVHHTMLCDSLSVTGGRSAVFSTNKTDRHDITEILLTVELNTINQP